MSNIVPQSNVEEWEHRLQCLDCNQTVFGVSYSGAIVIEEPPHKCRASVCGERSPRAHRVPGISPTGCVDMDGGGQA